MLKKIITVENPHGMHLRVAAQVVEASQKHKAKVTFYKDGKKASAKSILELLILEATQKSEITVVADGEGEQEALNQIETVLIDGAGI